MSLLESETLVEGLILHRPPHVHSLAAANEAAECYAAYRHELDPSQRLTLEGALAEREDHSWAAGEVGDFKGRQAGKNDAIEARELDGLVSGREKLILHTAHEFPTANEAFLRMESLFTNWDDLSAKVKRIRYANGEQGIELRNGARLKYRARTGGSGRGFAKADLVVYDEAQHLQPEQVAASAATIIANPNAQLWVAGSGGMSTSSVAWSMRMRALKGDAGRLAYTECTAQEWVEHDGKHRFVTPPIDDPLDHDLLTRCHPGYAAGRATRETLQTLLGLLGRELFIREVLCVWDPLPDSAAHSGPIDLDRFQRLIQANGEYQRSTAVLAVDVAYDRSWTSIGVVGMRDDGLTQCKLVALRPGTQWAAERIKELSDELGGARVTMAKNEPLIDDVEALGVTVTAMSGADQARASQKFIDACSGEAPTLRHRGEPALIKALEVAVPKAYGDGNTDFSRRLSPGDISPLKALTMAYGTDVEHDPALNVW